MPARVPVHNSRVSPANTRPASISRHPRFAFYAWFVLAFHVGVVLWGAYVRATGSGAGCGGHWPLCNGELIPRAPQIATLIEFTHRVTSGLALALVALLLFFAFRLFPAGQRVRRAASFAVVLTLTEALLGAALVLLGYVARNTSAWRGVVLGVHLVNTLLLLASLAVTAWLAGGRPAEGRAAELPGGPRLAWRLAIAGILATGVTGAIAALGDTLFTSATLAEGLRFDFSASAHPFLRVRILHPFVAAGLAACLLILASHALYSEPASRAISRLASALAALTVIQLSIGVLDLFLMAPVWVQLLHLLGADLLAITFVLLSAELFLPARGDAENRQTSFHGCIPGGSTF